MQRFRFSLARVLHFKEQRKRLEEARQQAIQARLQRLHEEEQAIVRRIEQAAALLSERVGQPRDVATWLAAYREAERLGRARTEIQGRIEQAQKELQEASARRRQLAVDVEALACVRQRQWKQHQYEAQRQEQIVLDELGLRRWQDARPEGQEP